MAVQVSYPGVYVQEVPSGVRTITGVSTSVGMFIGMASQGPLNEPTRVLGFTDYERTFGTDVSAGEMADQVRQFFQNGGRQAYVARIADGAVASSAALQDETGNDDVLVLEARSAGVIGGTVRIEVDYHTASPESTFNLTVYREAADPSGTPQVVETETYRDLTLRPGARGNAVSVLNLNSRLVRATLAAGAPAPIQGFSIAGVLMDPAGPGGVAELNDIIAAVDPVDNKGRFRISVDGRAFVTAEIAAPASDSAGDVDVAITDPVNAALAATGTTISAAVVSFGGFNVLRIASNTAGGSVQLAPALSKDVAVPMQMGAAQGGLEVDGYAPRRPAPTGFVSRIGTPGLGGGDLQALQDFADTDPATATSATVSDATHPGGHPALPLTWPTGGPTLSRGSLTGAQEDSLRNVLENLQELANQLDASGIPWQAERHGFRIALRPTFGGADADVSASIATAGGTDLGGGAAILDVDSNVRSYRLGTGLPGTYQTDGATGSDGVFPKLDQYADAFEIIGRDVDLFNIMVLPRAADQSDDDRAEIWPAASTFCQEQRAFLLIDPREDWTDIAAVTTGPSGIQTLRIGGVKDHAAVYWPRVRIAAPEGGQRTIDPAGSIAGLMSRIDGNRGVWKATAGLEADLRGVRGVERPMSDPENGVINPEAVNAVRVFPNGVVSWGARTLDGFDNSPNNDYRYVPVRRLALFLEESLYRGLKFAVFEPNDEPLWAEIRLAAGAFMNNLFRQGAFQGQKKNDAYFVKVDSETTTQNDINLGIVNVVVGFAPLKPAEFVVVTIKQMAGQVQV